ncbi:MAG: hypothetical protein GKR90_08380 [Pseudomonadales bacterium]|nr:hypothetical protein [Pseudomonadales bacterium]
MSVTDLSGTYDVGTFTPLERPEQFGESLNLTPEQASQITTRFESLVQADQDAERKELKSTTYVSQGYNLFWMDFGESPSLVDGKFRTSILFEPSNGRKPAMTKYGAERLQGFLDEWRIVWRSPDPTVGLDGSRAWWVDDGDPSGPYDHIEQRSLAERCIVGSRSTAGPPMLPNYYNNYKRIVQTDGAIMILTEMIHDARIVRMNQPHRPPEIQTWLGDSVGRWEGATLVVDTTNFNETPALSGADENLHVIERFTKQPDGSILYQFEIDDPTIWAVTWKGEYVWRSAVGKVYEFACHEGNYAIGNVMRGARLLEADL